MTQVIEQSGPEITAEQLSRGHVDGEREFGGPEIRQRQVVDSLLQDVAPDPVDHPDAFCHRNELIRLHGAQLRAFPAHQDLCTHERSVRCAHLRSIGGVHLLFDLRPASFAENRVKALVAPTQLFTKNHVTAS